MMLNGKKLLLTGANGGLGRAIARRAAAEGAKLVLSDKDEVHSQAALAALHAAAPEAAAAALPADLRDATAVQAMMGDAVDTLGGLDGVINNAVMLADDDGFAAETSVDSWRTTLDTNVTGAFLVCKYALPHFIEQQSGAFVTMSSVVARSASAVPQIAYTSSKGALEAMTREIAIAHARDNIRANCVAPGPVLTDRTARYFDTPEKWQSRRQHIPMGRLGRPEEIAGTVCFLLSDDAAWQTGSVVHVDGGISAAYLVDDRNGSETP